MRLEYVEVARKWVREGHGPVLILSLQNVPEDLLSEVVPVREDNVLDVVWAVRLGMARFFHDPDRRLDPAVRDKLLCF